VVTHAAPSRDDVLRILGTVMDPEVPVISVVELGIVRNIAIDGAAVQVTVTPTYSGCPAMREIEHDIVSALEMNGIPGATIVTTYSPAWTTDWIDPVAHEKLRAYGIAPPAATTRDGFVTLTHRREPVRCPFCGSVDTELRSEFGSTACKAIHACNACKQPFDEFKPF
jgi:ring-1,2-phenylacetyl-CoA epoxidase subunit PaaD